MISKLKKQPQLQEHIRSSIPANWHRVISTDQVLELHDIATAIFNQTGIKLHATQDGDTVNGFLSGYILPNGGQGFCSLCQETLTDSIRHQCIIVSLYDVDATPPADQNPHKTTIKRKVITGDIEKKIEDCISGLVKK